MARNGVGNEHTEYGGGPGEPRRDAVGADKHLNAAERRRIFANSAQRGPDLKDSGDIATRGSTGISVEEVTALRARERTDVLKRANGYQANGDTSTRIA